MPVKWSRFLKELKRRKVYRVATVYAITGWLIIQIVVATFPHLHLPEWMITAIIILVLLGFPVAIILAWAFEMSPEGIIRTTSPESQDNPYPAHKIKPFTGTFTIIVLAVLLVAQFIYFRFIYDYGTRESIAQNEASLLPFKSIAVLPFKNLSEEKDNLYFSDGVMEAILNNLSRINDLKVVSRTSVERYRDDMKPIPEIASELEVANILEGSVQKTGNHVRITVQLISAADDEHIWASHYDRDISDLFNVQSEIAKTIAENLKIILTTEEREIIENAPTSSLKAYDLYLKATKHSRVSKKDIEEIITMLKEAITLDNNFAMAYAALGEHLNKLNRFEMPKTIWVDSAMAMLDRSMELDPSYAPAYRYKAHIYELLNMEEKVKENLLQGLQYDPNDPFILKYLGYYYDRMGQVDRAIDYFLKSMAVNKPDGNDPNFLDQMGKTFQNIDWKMLQKFYRNALESNPESLEVLNWLGKIEFLDGNYEAALQYFLKIEQIDLENNFINAPIGLCYIMNQQYGQAEQYFNRAEIFDEQENESSDLEWLTPFVAFNKIKLGKIEEGDKLMQTFKDTMMRSRQDIYSSTSPEYCTQFARIFTYENNPDEAFLFLEKGIKYEKQFFWSLFWVRNDPLLDGLRRDERYSSILKDLSDEEAYRKQLLRTKLAEYHARNELKWLRVD